MPSKSQSSGPAPNTSQPKVASSRKGEAANQSEQTSSGRAGSAGGIMLEKEQVRKRVGSPAPSTVTKAATPSPAKEKKAATTAGPNRQRRRPRKLNKEPAPAQNATAASAATDAGDATPPAATIEIEALKSRVRSLEAKVEELYKAAEARTGCSPRRRGKGRKGSSTQVSTTSTTAQPVQVEDEEEADEELVRLEGELEVARRDLESYRPRNRPRTKRSGSAESVEEIPRDGIGGVDDTVNTGDRQVTLTGNYRIPLPSSVSMVDVKSIQSGVSAAQNVAKSFLEQRRAAQAARNPSPAATTRTPEPSRRSSSMEVTKENTGQSWGEWFGGYSIAISRAVKNIEAEAAIESQKRPAAAGRTASAPGTAKRAATGGGEAATTKAGRRPAMKARQGNLSSEQVQGLMS